MTDTIGIRGLTVRHLDGGELYIEIWNRLAPDGPILHMRIQLFPEEVERLIDFLNRPKSKT